MTLIVKQLTVPVSAENLDPDFPRLLAQHLGCSPDDFTQISILKKSLDARRKSRLVHHYQLRIEHREEQALLQTASSLLDPLHEKPAFQPLDGIEQKRLSFRHRPLIIGSGPAGTFAAQVLTEAGVPCLVLERGEPVEARMRTVHKLLRESVFSEESNYCYGEGGAGTFSDGKLTCGRNHPLIRYLFEQWVRFGAPEDILYDAHPHIGTDYLMRIAIRTREHLKSLGTEYLFQAKVIDITPGQQARHCVKLANGDSYESDHVILAIGHSARESYQMLYDRGLAIGPKPFAIGARLEHPQELINSIQYGSCDLLPAAEYKLAAQVDGRGIWTFCMCPGGHLLPTGASAGHLAINGMSYHARQSGFANAAVVVNVNRDDFYRGHPLDGMHFQAALEQAAFQAGGADYFSPAQKLGDFLQGRLSTGSMNSSYKPGIRSARLDQLLPDFVVSTLRKGLSEYNKKMQGFLSDQAIVAGVETKTSAPIVMHRDESLQSISHPGIFPAGEGAGFAGGIVSAALDGVKIGRAVLQSSYQLPVATIH